VSVVCCQVEVSVTDWSLVQRSPTDCGSSLCVIKKRRKKEKTTSRYRYCESTNTVVCNAKENKQTNKQTRYIPDCNNLLCIFYITIAFFMTSVIQQIYCVLYCDYVYILGLYL
jgi:hypothetical protein